MDRKTAVLLVLLFASLFLLAIRVSMDFPQGLGIYNGSTSAANPEGTIRFKTAIQVQVILIDPPDNTIYTIPGTSMDINLTCQANNLTAGVNITQIRLYTNITGVFVVTNTTNVSGTPPFNVTFNLTAVPLGSYRWNCEAVSNVGNVSALSDWHFTIRQPGVPPPPPSGGGGRRPPTKIEKEAVIPPPPPVMEIPLPPPPVHIPEPNIIHEFTLPADISLKQSETNLMIKVPGETDARILGITASEESMINIVSEANPMPAYLDEWALLSTVRMWKLKPGEWQDFPLIAENQMLDYRPVSSARLSSKNSIPIEIKTKATGEESGNTLSVYSVAEMPLIGPRYFVKFTDVVDGYVGVYFVLDGYHFSTVENDFMVDFELSLDKDLVLGDILSSAKLYPGEYNIIYKRYKLPDLPEKAVYTLTSRVYEKGPILPKIAITYHSNVDFRKETPTQMGKTIIS